jgi:hypothetical protein
VRPLVLLDRLLRIASGLLLLLAVPLVLLAALFATDAGTQEAMDFSRSILVVGLLGIAFLLFAVIAPQKLERWVPGPPLTGVILVRGLCYLAALAVLVLLLFARAQQ